MSGNTTFMQRTAKAVAARARVLANGFVSGTSAALHLTDPTNVYGTDCHVIGFGTVLPAASWITPHPDARGLIGS